MNNTFKVYGFILVIVLGLLAVLQANKKEAINWQKNYDINSKSPFGLFIFNKEIDTILGKPVKRITESPYTYFNKEENKNHSPKNILVIQQYLDEESEKLLLKQAEQGSDIFIISDDPFGLIYDSLRIGQYELISYKENNILHLTDKKFKDVELPIGKLPTGYGFSYVNKKTETLGYTSEQKIILGANFVRVKHGKGWVYLHGEPLFITNYYLLQQKSDAYVKDVLSYLPSRQTLWFNNVEPNEQKSASPLRFILENPPLKYAWWTLLLGFLLFIIFNAKRKQRIVPIVDPVINKSTEFVKSIGNLYLQEGDFHDMMAKKAQYFLHRIRLELLIDTNHLDDKFVQTLQIKTAQPEEKIVEAVNLIKLGLDPYANVMQEDLVRMNTLLNEILK